MNKASHRGQFLVLCYLTYFINDLLPIINVTNICNFADDNTLYACGTSMETIISNLSSDLSIVLVWFKENMLVANPKKFQMMLLGNNIEPVEINVENFVIKNSKSVELLSIVFDSNLSFEEYILNLCKSANYNVIRLNRVRKLINLKQSILLFNAFIISKFMYAPAVWMFCSKTLYLRMHKVFKRATKVLKSSSVAEDLLQSAGVTTIHELHLRQLLSEVFKSLNHDNPAFMSWLFPPKSIPYSLRRQNLLEIPNSDSVRHGINSFSFRASILWNKIPDTIKTSGNISEFKSKLCELNLTSLCTCKICRT